MALKKRARRVTAGAAAAAALALASARGEPAPQSAPVDSVLERAVGYSAAYAEKMSLVLASERYEQRVADDSRARGNRKGLSRVRVSDVLWVPQDDDVVLAFYRDVHSVDGRPLRDRGDRLLQLFPHGPSDVGRSRAAEILNESARLNLGSAYWNANFPTLALVFLHPRNRQRVDYRRKGEARLEGRRVVEIEYREIVSPTLLRSSATGANYAANGTFWIAQDGAVVRSDLRFEGVGRTRVSYRYEPHVGAFVPHEMRDVFGGRGTLETIEGTATYTHYRRGDAEVGPIQYKR